MGANIVWFIGFFLKKKKYIDMLLKKKRKEINIIELNLPFNLNGDTWGQRALHRINKIIVHQALSEGDTIAVHKYHISDNSHLKAGGAPRIAYHYTIEKCGTIYKVNDLKDIVWHCRGQNTSSVGILLLGNFDGPNYIGESSPTEKQLSSLDKLLTYLAKELNIEDNYIYGHCEFGKLICPGNETERFIKRYQEKNEKTKSDKP